jgi:hypothetical protein
MECRLRGCGRFGNLHFGGRPLAGASATSVVEPALMVAVPGLAACLPVPIWGVRRSAGGQGKGSCRRWGASGNLAVPLRTVHRAVGYAGRVSGGGPSAPTRSDHREVTTLSWVGWPGSPGSRLVCVFSGWQPQVPGHPLGALWRIGRRSSDGATHAARRSSSKAFVVPVPIIPWVESDDRLQVLPC